MYGAARKKYVGYVPLACPAIGASELALAVYIECGVWHVVHNRYAFAGLLSGNATGEPCPFEMILGAP